MLPKLKHAHALASEYDGSLTMHWMMMTTQRSNAMQHANRRSAYRFMCNTWRKSVTLNFSHCVMQPSQCWLQDNVDNSILNVTMYCFQLWCAHAFVTVNVNHEKALCVWFSTEKSNRVSCRMFRTTCISKFPEMNAFIQFQLNHNWIRSKIVEHALYYGAVAIWIAAMHAT